MKWSGRLMGALVRLCQASSRVMSQIHMMLCSRLTTSFSTQMKNDLFGKSSFSCNIERVGEMG